MQAQVESYYFLRWQHAPLHGIMACVIFDVFGPPYSINEDRGCTYYQDLPYSHHVSLHYLVESHGNIFWLRGTLNGDSICMYKLSISMYKLNLSSYSWDKTHSSEGCCFFLSQRTSISVSVSHFKDNEEKLYFPMLQN